MLIWGSIIILGSISYMILNNGEVKEKEIIEEVKEEIEEIESNYKKTYLYFIDKLTLEEQRQYVETNLYLQDYRHLLTDSKFFNAKKFANISEKLGKEFTNINKRY